MSHLDQILDNLVDSEVHDVEEVKRLTGLKEDQIVEALRFMAEFHFIMFDELTGSVAAVLPIRKLFEGKSRRFADT